MDAVRSAGHDLLTEREQEILGLIAEGFSNQQIADQLFLTLGTVKWYNQQIFQKLGVRSRTQAILRTRELGLLNEDAPKPDDPLPAQNTAFIGRARELRDIVSLLDDPACRLLTLAGPGGIGKTRLALEAARRQRNHFPDGVYFVPFAPVASPQFVALTLEARLGLSHTSQRDPLTQVIDFLRKKKLLLVIDNFEHLLAGVGLLAQILDGSNDVKMLVTSRERLRLKGEWVYDVKGLDFPAVGRDDQEPVELAEYDAGQLFLQTARRVQADFAPGKTDKAQIARICQFLEGMPLGIELAASWVRLLSCAGIAREITYSLDALNAAWRDIPERHRSLRAVLDHSWGLLDAGEQDALQRLSVFNGGFGRSAAEAVAGESLPVLLALVDKSFLQRVDPDRFGFHELVKQYASEKLRAVPDLSAEVQLRHCRYHASFLHERMRALDANAHLDEIQMVFTDIQAAWRYAVENKRLAEIQQFADGFLEYYRLHSWYRAGSDALAWYERALACFASDIGHDDYRPAAACLYESLGNLHGLATSHKKAIAAYEKALDNTFEGDQVRRGRLYGKLADIQVAMNQHEQAGESYAMAESVLETAAQRDATWWGEWFRIQLQRLELYYWGNSLDDMAGQADRIRPLIEAHGSAAHRMRYLYLLGMMALRRDRYFYSSDAVAYTGEALALSLETGNLGDIATMHFSHGFSHLWSDHFDEAEKHLQQTREMAEYNGDLALLTRALAYLTLIYRRRGDGERVREYADDIRQIAEEAKMPQYTGMAHAHEAWLSWRSGDLEETKSRAHAAINDWGGLGQAQAIVPFRWLALFPLLGAALKQEEIEQAVVWAKHMIMPLQQRLPYDLNGLLENAVSAWEEHQQSTAYHLLLEALKQARALHYA